MTEPSDSASAQAASELEPIGFEDSSITFQPDLLTPVNNTNFVDDFSSRSHSQQSYGNQSTPFFADAMLDLDEAHDIAETPESAPRPMVTATTRIPSAGLLASSNLDQQSHLHVPSLGLLPEEHDSDLADNNSILQEERDSASPTNSPTFQKQLSRITSSSLETDLGRPSLSASVQSRLMVRPKTLPKRPRDIGWAIAFGLVVPLGLLGPFFVAKDGTYSPLAQYPLSTASLHTLAWSALAALLLSRVLYLTRDGGGGGGALTAASASTSLSNSSSLTALVLLYNLLDSCTRIDTNSMASKLTTLAPVLAVAVACLNTGFLWWALQHPMARLFVCICSLWYILRQDNVSVLDWLRSRRRFGGGSGASPRHHYVASTLPTQDTSHATSTLASRQAFFQALLCVALDVLSRSLRRRSFYRALVLLGSIQWGLLWLWRFALLRLLQTPYSSSWMWLALTIVAGKWATGTVARMLSLLASGGVLCWFMEQAQQLPPLSTRKGESTENRNEMNLHEATEPQTSQTRSQSNIPEAYRDVDASVYESVLDIDDALEDDYDVDEAEFETFSHERINPFQRGQQPSTQATPTSVKGFLSAGITVSFGSVAQCGLLGGLAQFVWSQVRKVDAARSVIAQARQAGFQGMQIGRRNATILSRIGGLLGNVSKGFISRFSDLPMSHVAAYYKSYRIAARDVTLIIEESGVEQIIHDDISTHMCACVGGSIAGTIVVITHFIMVHQLKTRVDVTHWQIAENFFLSFALAYTLLFTVMEPIRAAIKGIYIAFAQHPRSLSQTFPLVYHRLNRLSENGAIS